MSSVQTGIHSRSGREAAALRCHLLTLEIRSINLGHASQCWPRIEGQDLNNNQFIVSVAQRRENASEHWRGVQISLIPTSTLDSVVNHKRSHCHSCRGLDLHFAAITAFVVLPAPLPDHTASLSSHLCNPALRLKFRSADFAKSKQRAGPTKRQDGEHRESRR